MHRPAGLIPIYILQDFYSISYDCLFFFNCREVKKGWILPTFTKTGTFTHVSSTRELNYTHSFERYHDQAPESSFEAPILQRDTYS